MYTLSVKLSRSDGLALGLSCALMALVLLGCCFGAHKLVEAQPTASLNLFSPSSNKLEGKVTASDDSAEQSFRQLVQSEPDSTVIGEFKSNASALELMLLRSKIANTIMKMQEMDKLQAVSAGQQASESTGADCYIEVTRIEKVVGKCRRASGGLPICQSENYVAVSSECGR